MDDPSCSEPALLATVRQFALINRLFSRSLPIFLKYCKEGLQTRRDSPIRVLDVGAGGGDFARDLCRWAQKKNISLEVTCLDNDPRIVAYTRDQCRDFKEIAVVKGNFFNTELLATPFAYVFANHFLHHIDSKDIPAALHRFEQLSTEAYLINDLSRSPRSYILYSLFASIFFPSSFAWYDGRLSIHKGFTKEELIRLTAKAKLKNTPRVQRELPGRLIIYGAFE